MENFLPYPPFPSQKDKENQFAHFVDIFKKLKINISFSKALQKMSAYARFMKDLLTKKREYIEKETIEVQGNCSAIIKSCCRQNSKNLVVSLFPIQLEFWPLGKH